MTEAQTTGINDHSSYEGSSEQLAGNPPTANQKFDHSEFNKLKNTIDQHAPIINRAALHSGSEVARPMSRIWCVGDVLNVVDSSASVIGSDESLEDVRFKVSDGSTELSVTIDAGGSGSLNVSTLDADSIWDISHIVAEGLDSESTTVTSTTKEKLKYSPSRTELNHSTSGFDVESFPTSPINVSSLAVSGDVIIDHYNDHGTIFWDILNGAPRMRFFHPIIKPEYHRVIEQGPVLATAADSLPTRAALSNALDITPIASLTVENITPVARVYAFRYRIRRFTVSGINITGDNNQVSFRAYLSINGGAESLVMSSGQRSHIQGSTGGGYESFSVEIQNQHDAQWTLRPGETQTHALRLEITAGSQFPHEIYISTPGIEIIAQ